MTEIDVPDWVVVLAGEAYVNHGGEYSRYAMERALTAALGAWVVPASRQFQDRDGGWQNFVNEHHERNTADSMAWPMRTLYTLRQEKPE